MMSDNSNNFQPLPARYYLFKHGYLYIECNQQCRPYIGLGIELQNFPHSLYTLGLKSEWVSGLIDNYQQLYKQSRILWLSNQIIFDNYQNLSNINTRKENGTLTEEWLLEQKLKDNSYPNFTQWKTPLIIRETCNSTSNCYGINFFPIEHVQDPRYAIQEIDPAKYTDHQLKNKFKVWPGFINSFRFWYNYMQGLPNKYCNLNSQEIEDSETVAYLEIIETEAAKNPLRDLYNDRLDQKIMKEILKKDEIYKHKRSHFRPKIPENKYGVDSVHLFHYPGRVDLFFAGRVVRYIQQLNKMLFTKEEKAVVELYGDQAEFLQKKLQKTLIFNSSLLPIKASPFEVSNIENKHDILTRHKDLIRYESLFSKSVTLGNTFIQRNNVKAKLQNNISLENKEVQERKAQINSIEEAIIEDENCCGQTTQVSTQNQLNYIIYDDNTSDNSINEEPLNNNNGKLMENEQKIEEKLIKQYSAGIDTDPNFPVLNQNGDNINSIKDETIHYVEVKDNTEFIINNMNNNSDNQNISTSLKRVHELIHASSELGKINSHDCTNPNDCSFNDIRSNNNCSSPILSSKKAKLEIKDKESKETTISHPIPLLEFSEYTFNIVMQLNSVKTILNSQQIEWLKDKIQNRESTQDQVEQMKSRLDNLLKIKSLLEDHDNPLQITTAERIELVGKVFRMGNSIQLSLSLLQRLLILVAHPPSSKQLLKDISK